MEKKQMAEQDSHTSAYGANRHAAQRIHVDPDDSPRPLPNGGSRSNAGTERSSMADTARYPGSRGARSAASHDARVHPRSSNPRTPHRNGVAFDSRKTSLPPAGHAPYKPTQARTQSSGNALRRIAPLVAGIIVLVILILFAASKVRSCAATQDAVVEAEPSRVSFVAVGDNLPDNTIGEWADAQAGQTGDGEYDYSGIYEPIKEYIQSADLAYCKQETHCGGDEIGPKGYPSFNTTDAMADAIVSTGFDLVASASNHCYDWGSYGANEHSCSLWASKDVTFTGTYTSEAAYNTIATTTVNGITFSLLDYTYGVNGYTQDELPEYCVKFIDEDLIRTEVTKARQISDVVIVSMHWGTENQTDPDETQLEYAQLLADLGVDVILGSHPHVIGPLAWIEGKDGHQTLCAYSLGNFVSSHETPHEINELEGMLSCTFVKEAADDAQASASSSPRTTSDAQVSDSTSSSAQDYTISIQDVTWIPLVNHTTASTHAVYALKDYTESLAAEHTFLGGNGAEAISWLRSTTQEVVNSQGSSFEIDDGSSATASSSPRAKKWLFF